MAYLPSIYSNDQFGQLNVNYVGLQWGPWGPFYIVNNSSRSHWPKARRSRINPTLNEASGDFTSNRFPATPSLNRVFFILYFPHRSNEAKMQGTLSGNCTTRSPDCCEPEDTNCLLKVFSWSLAPSYRCNHSSDFLFSTLGPHCWVKSRYAIRSYTPLVRPLFLTCISAHLLCLLCHLFRLRFVVVWPPPYRRNYVPPYAVVSLRTSESVHFDYLLFPHAPPCPAGYRTAGTEPVPRHAPSPFPASGHASPSGSRLSGRASHRYLTRPGSNASSFWTQILFRILARRNRGRTFWEYFIGFSERRKVFESKSIARSARARGSYVCVAPGVPPNPSHGQRVMIIKRVLCHRLHKSEALGDSSFRRVGVLLSSA